MSSIAWESDRLKFVRRRGIGLVAHDRCKDDLREWAVAHRGSLLAHRLYATGTTGRLLRQRAGLEVACLSSGPLGGDQQIGSRIVEGEIDALFFFWDPLSAHPHGDDVRALARIAVLTGIPTAFNRATADLVIAALGRDAPERAAGSLS